MHKTIGTRARELASYTAQNLSQIVRVPSLSGDEQAVIEQLAELCTQAGLRDVRVDGLGNLIARVGGGPRVLATLNILEHFNLDIMDWDDPLAVHTIKKCAASCCGDDGVLLKKYEQAAKN